MPFKLLIGAACLFAFVGCGDFKEDHYERIDNIVRVMMHERGHYTFVVQKPGSNEMELVSRGHYAIKEERFYADVPESEKMWAEVVHYSNYGDGYTNIFIHVHSEKNIEGGGWNHGKKGRGETEVIK